MAGYNWSKRQTGIKLMRDPRKPRTEAQLLATARRAKVRRRVRVPIIGEWIDEEQDHPV